MPFQCYWSTQPSYDTHQRVKDFWFRLIRSEHHAFICLNQVALLEADLAYISERTGWVGGRVHEFIFNSFDLIRGVFEIEKALSPVERILMSQYSSPRWKTIINYSSLGFENLDYGEVE